MEEKFGKSKSKISEMKCKVLSYNPYSKVVVFLFEGKKVQATLSYDLKGEEITVKYEKDADGKVNFLKF